MGIPKFYGFLRQNELFKQIILENLPPERDILLIDMNGLIHTNAQIEFGYGASQKGAIPVQNVRGELIVSQAELYNRRFNVFRRVFDDVVRLTRLINPRRSLVLAVDGVPPEAKIMQQRGRRYDAAASRETRQAFDSNAINPGTEFMRELDQFIRSQLQQITSLGSHRSPWLRIFPPHILYSSYRVPGEGEHKIADHLREIQAGDQTVIVYGTDTDLIMIYLLRLKDGWKNIYLFRENEFRGRTQVNVVDLRKLAHILERLYPGVPSPLDDFVTLLFLNGNDFLPHFPVFERVWDALQTLIFGYRAFLEKNPGKGLSSERINWTNFGEFCQFVGQEWNNILLTAWATNSDNLIKFPSIVAEKCSRELRTVQGGQISCRREFNREAFDQEWYTSIFSPKNGKGIIIPTQEDKRALIKFYLEGLAWVFNYYKFGSKRLNVGWYYPYHYSPVFTDLGKFILENPVTWEINPIISHSEFVSPLEQMLQVMPPKSVNLLPEVLRGMYTDASPIYDLFPESFVVDKGGKQEEWQGVPLLPFPDPLRVRWALSLLNLPQDFLQAYAPEENLVITQDLNRAFRTATQNTRRGRGRGRYP